jgi:PAS domain S-box-containing protein
MREKVKQLTKEADIEALRKRLSELESKEANLKRELEVSNTERLQLASIFYSIDEIIYISTPDTYKILYANLAARNLFGNLIGQRCYEAFHGFKSPCPFCTNENIFGKNLGKTYVWECQNQINKRWYRCIDKAIRWPGDRMVRYEVAIDITDRKKAEEALRESEELYRTVIEESADSIYLADVETKRVLQANKAFKRLLGYNDEDILRLSVYDFISASRENINSKIKEITAGKNFYKGERLYRRKDGIFIDVEVSVSLISYGGRNVFCGIARDITERKRTQEVITKSERFLNTIFDSINDPFNIIDKDFMIIKANQSYAEMRGMTVDDLVGRRCYEVLQNRKTICEGCSVKITFETGKPNSKEKLVMYPGNPEETWLEIYTYPIFDDKGKVVNVIEYTRDISNRKTLEEQLIANGRKYKTLFQDTRDALYITTRTGKFIEVNNSMLDLFGYTRDEMLNIKATDIYAHPSDRSAFQENIERDGFVKDYPVKFRRKDGSVMDCIITSSVWGSDDDKVQGYQGIIFDVSKYKKTE